MKFREHRGTLDESMQTVVEIPATREALEAQIRDIYKEWPRDQLPKELDIKVVKSVFDGRIGWDTYMVVVVGVGTVGFTDSAVEGIVTS